MGLAVGILGLANVGKSTTFNALCKAQAAQAANYPFCTIEPNIAQVEVPDLRLNELSKIVKPQRLQYSTVDFTDIAGLVRGASRGEGLGNQFLSHIKECEVLLHVVRCFEDSNITHTEGSVDSLRDAELINTELILADISACERKIERLARQAKSDKQAAQELELAKALLAYLGDGNKAQGFAATLTEAQSPIWQGFNQEMRFLSAKEMIYAANVDEEGLSLDNDHVKALREYIENAPLIKLCARLEEELIGLDDAEALELLSSFGMKESALSLIIKESFARLGLISYFTAGVKEVRAWTITKGDKAPRAASVIHKDFEKGFIRAEVISYEDFIAHNGEAGAKAAGKMRLEGKDYVVNDGDLMHFRFAL